MWEMFNKRDKMISEFSICSSNVAKHKKMNMKNVEVTPWYKSYHNLKACLLGHFFFQKCPRTWEEINYL